MLAREGMTTAFLFLRVITKSEERDTKKERTLLEAGNNKNYQSALMFTETFGAVFELFYIFNCNSGFQQCLENIITT